MVVNCMSIYPKTESSRVAIIQVQHIILNLGWQTPIVRTSVHSEESCYRNPCLSLTQDLSNIISVVVLVVILI